MTIQKFQKKFNFNSFLNFQIFFHIIFFYIILFFTNNINAIRTNWVNDMTSGQTPMTGGKW